MLRVIIMYYNEQTFTQLSWRSSMSFLAWQNASSRWFYSWCFLPFASSMIAVVSYNFSCLSVYYSTQDGSDARSSLREASLLEARFRLKWRSPRLAPERKLLSIIDCFRHLLTEIPYWAYEKVAKNSTKAVDSIQWSRPCQWSSDGIVNPPTSFRQRLEEISKCRCLCSASDKVVQVNRTRIL